MGNLVLEKVQKERDLGVMIDQTGKVEEQCSMAVRKANNVLRQIRRKIRCMSKNVILGLYKSLVRPHLDYCVQAWCPYLIKDKLAMERVQRRALRLIDNFKYLSYEDRLEKVKLTSLEKRRERGDMIQVFKIMKGIDKLDGTIFFKTSRSLHLRGHKLKVYKQRSRTDWRKTNFSLRDVDAWNKLQSM